MWARDLKQESKLKPLRIPKDALWCFPILCFVLIFQLTGTTATQSFSQSVYQSEPVLIWAQNNLISPMLSFRNPHGFKEPIHTLPSLSSSHVFCHVHAALSGWSILLAHTQQWNSNCFTWNGLFSSFISFPLLPHGACFAPTVWVLCCQQHLISFLVHLMRSRMLRITASHPFFLLKMPRRIAVRWVAYTLIRFIHNEQISICRPK